MFTVNRYSIDMTSKKNKETQKENGEKGPGKNVNFFSFTLLQYKQ